MNLGTQRGSTRLHPGKLTLEELWTCRKADYRMSNEGQEIFPSPDPTLIDFKPSNKNPQ